MNIIGVDLGGTNIATALIKDGKMCSRTRELVSHENEEYILDQIYQSVLRILEREKLSVDEIEGVGVAVPGWTDAKSGNVIFTPNLPIKDFPLAKRLQEKIGCNIKIENDGNCAVLGEHVFGDYKNEKNMLMITVGTGIGGGIIINGKLLEGVGSAELAHMTMDINGEQCNCGKRGCVETFISATALLKLCNKLVKVNPRSCLFKSDKIDCEDIFKAFINHDNGAIKIIDIYMGYFAQAILNYSSVFGNMNFIIGGGISNAGKIFFDTLNQKVSLMVKELNYNAFVPKIYPASLGNNSEIYGAAVLFKGKEE